MIGMPRITLIRLALSPDRARTPETRINAQSSPRIVDRTSEPTVTTIVSQTPCRRIGRNSVASRRKFALLEIVGKDRVVGETSLEATRVHVPQDVRNGVVHLDLTEQSGLFQCIDKGGADLGPDDLALQIFRRGIVFLVGLRHQQTL